MAKCAAGEDCKTPEESLFGTMHIEADYEVFNQYHPQCCPRVLLGDPCDYDHPDDREGDEPDGR